MTGKWRVKANQLRRATFEKNDVHAGISFWVVFDWAQYGIQAFENHLAKLILKSNLNLHSCKAIKGRGKKMDYHEFVIVGNKYILKFDKS